MNAARRPLFLNGSARAATLALALLLAGCGPAGSATYYVDFDQGDDSRAGTSPETAWQRAPGDPEAKGRAGTAGLTAGDTVIFRAGVHYRGTIENRFSGSAAKPITFTGLGWGNGMGIIDGSDAVVSASRCTSAADCGGAPGWEHLTRITHRGPPSGSIFLFGAKGLYWRSQLPIPEDRFYPDNTKGFIATPVATASELAGGRLNNAELATAAAAGGGDMQLVFWVTGNEIRSTPVKAVLSQRLEFAVDGLRLPERRDGKVALINSFAGLTEPGTYLVMGKGVLLAWLREGDDAATLRVGMDRSGFDLSGQSHVRIDGLAFQNFTGTKEASRLGNTAIRNRRPTGTDFQIRGSRLGPAALEHGGGIISLSYTSGFKLLSSRIENIQFGSGVRTGPANADVTIMGNVFQRLGRTAVGFLSVDGATVSGNFLADIRGIHGNALTTYLRNRNVVISGNCVVNASRPLTFHGDNTPDVANGITIKDNIFISSPTGQGAIISWGRQTNGVKIIGNLALGNKVGMLLHANDRNIEVRNNIGNRISVRNSAKDGPDNDAGRQLPEGWVMANNIDTLARTGLKNASFTEDSCAVTADGQSFSTTRTPR